MIAPAPTLRRGARQGARLRQSDRLGRGARRAATLLSAAFAAAALALGAAAPSGAAPAPARTATTATSSTAHLTASLTADNAGVLTPGKELAVSVTVTNPTDAAYDSGKVTLWYEPDAAKSRSSLMAWLGSTAAVEGKATLGSAALPRIESGTSTVVRVTVPAAAIPFRGEKAQSVYGIGASVSATPAAGDTTGTTGTTGTAAAAETRGSLVWNPGGAATRANVAVAIPIVSPSSADGLISSDDLAAFTAPNGVLTRDLDGLEGHSTVAVGIDPMIIASIRALGNAAPPTALDWLQRLATLPNDTFSLGYGDADLTGQLQSGLAAPLALTSLDYALDAKNFTPSPTPIGEPSTATPTPTVPTPTPTSTPGAGTELPSLDSLLAWDYTLKGVAWPGDKTVRAADLGPLSAAGFATTLVSGSNTNAAGLSSTPNAAFTSGKYHLAAADQALSEALRQAISAPSDLAWNTAMSRLNAQLELIGQEGDGSRDLLVALDRSWPSSGTQLQRTLAALFSSPWATPATLPAVLSAAPSGGLTLTDAPEATSRIDSIKALLSDEQALDDFATVLDDPATMTGRVRAELLSLLAVSWQNPRTDWTAAVTKTRAATTKTLRSIRILPTENVNLVSAQGSIPFTVSNELGDEAANVVLTASPSNSRLEIDEAATKRIPQDSRVTMLVPVKAKLGNGQVVLSLRLYSPKGVPIGEPSSVTVDVHADWEGIGALILGVLLVLLFGFGIVRNILRRRDQRKRAAESPEPGDEPATPEETPSPEDAPAPEDRADG